MKTRTSLLIVAMLLAGIVLQAQSLVDYSLVPGGGESYQQGAAVELQWLDKFESTPIAIEVWRQGTTTWNTLMIVNSSVAAAQWMIPSTCPVGKYRIRIRSILDSSVLHYSYGLINIEPQEAAALPRVNSSKPVASGMALHPNPTNGILEITHEEGIMDLRVYNTLGEQLHHLVLDGRRSTVLDAGWLRAGQYLIALRTTNGAVALKSFIKL